MKTRIKIVQKVNGDTYYVAQKRWFFIWEDIYAIGAWHYHISHAKDDIDRHLKKNADQKQKVTYEEYPVTPRRSL